MAKGKTIIAGLAERWLAVAKRQPQLVASASILIFALVLGLAAMPFLVGQRSDANAQSTDAFASALDDVDECDLLAAHPSDPERVADGIADDAIVPRLAVRACEVAVKRSPNEARFTFQLGRALLAAKRREEAAQHLERAAQRDYAAGLAYLGDAYQFGYGVKADSKRALEAYRKALARGFEPAEGQIEMLTFQADKYMTPIPSVLFQGDMSSLISTSDQAINVYLYGFVATLAQECQSLLPPPVMLHALRRRYPDNWQPESDVHFNVMRIGPAGEYDARAFVQRHGCDGPIAREMGSRVVRLLVPR